MSGFVHLHCHSTWSLLDGAMPAEALPHIAAHLGFEAIALTDHDALTGAVRFARACSDAGIKPIFGAELTLRVAAGSRGAAGGGHLPPAPNRSESPPAGTRRPRSQKGDTHVTLIARDNVGYANLCRLITDAHLSNERGEPATTFEKVVERSEGLFVLSGCARGEVARLAARGRMDEAVAAARRWRNAVGEAYRIEVFDHRRYGDRILRDRLLAVARAVGVQAVATNDVHYALPSDAGTHEVLHAIKDIVPLSPSRSLRANAEYHLKPPGEMRALFRDVPEVADETLRIAEACDVDLGLGRYHFPDMGRGRPPAAELRERCFAGAARRFGRITGAVAERLEHELAMIASARPQEQGGVASARPQEHGGVASARPQDQGGFAAYFLLVADIVDHSKRVLGIRCACRGSAAGSLVCYALGISDVDPVRYDLLFERFMNERRDELPDIDIDVESHRREDVLAHILDTYGTEQTAMCCMVDTFRARMAIRDVGKAIGLPPDEIDVVAKAFPRIRASHIPQALENLPELRGSNLRSADLQRLFELCIAIDGFPRHLALHPSGVILSSADLADRVPMQTSFGGFTMLQADKDDVEELGLVKLDVLGVRMLSSISHACGEIARTRGAPVDLETLPHDDEVTYRLMRSSRTLGCFQIESPGQRDLLARLQPERFEDLIVDISLFRPGPVKSDMVKPFLARRHGFDRTTYLHDCLRPILAETNGVIVYHEQLIRAIAAVTGCSLADADHVRRHLDSERATLTEAPGHGAGERFMDRRLPDDVSIARWFHERAIGNGFSSEDAATLWREVFAFASFGFCKSHAAAFALPTYLSAWLKAHYPAEFYAGLLTHDPGMYPRRLIAADARHFGVAILPIDVNRSDRVYRAEPHGAAAGDRGAAGGGHPPPARNRSESPPAGTRRPRFNDHGESPPPGTRRPRFNDRRPHDQQAEGPRGEPSPQSGWGVRLALSEVREISAREIDSILGAREEGPFSSLEDLWRRAQVSRPVLENLVHIGALDGISGGRSRRELLWRGTDLARRPPPADGAQLRLELEEAEALSPAQLPGLAPYTSREETEAELEVGGIDARRHVMELYRPLLAELGCTPASELARRRNDSEVWVAGVKVASQTPAIRSGQRIIFVTLDDLTGPIDLTLFERVQPWCAATAFHSWILLVRGTLRKRGGASLIRRTDPANVGVTIVVEEIFDLVEVAQERIRGVPLDEAVERQRERQAEGCAAAPDTADQERLRPSGRAWHSSGGSAGA